MAPRQHYFTFHFVAWIDGRPKRSEPTKVPREASLSKLYETASDAFGLALGSFNLAVTHGRGTKAIIAERSIRVSMLRKECMHIMSCGELPYCCLSHAPSSSSQLFVSAIFESGVLTSRMRSSSRSVASPHQTEVKDETRHSSSLTEVTEVRFPFPYPIFARAVPSESDFLIVSFFLGDGCDGILLVCCNYTEEDKESDTRMPAVHDGPTTAFIPSHGHGDAEKKNILPPASIPEEGAIFPVILLSRSWSLIITTGTQCHQHTHKAPVSSSLHDIPGFRKAKRARHQLEGNEMLLIGAALAKADPTDACPALSDTYAREYVKSCRQIMRKSQDDEDEVRRRS